MISEHREKTVILAVDDKPDDLRSTMLAGLNGRARVEVLHPSDIEQEHLDKANLVLVDYKLDDWPERNKQSTPFKIETGLALATVLREMTGKDRFTAIALHTGLLTEARDRIRLPHASHVLARLNNLEWVFAKDDENRFDQMVLLAGATQRLNRKWPTDHSESKARALELLSLNENVEWSDRCWQDVRECQPPIFEMVGEAHGGLFIRWLLHQILPYPCFLWDAHSVAARLRLSVDDFRRVALSGNRLAEELKALKYCGILAGFLGDRWWRSAVEDYAWELVDGSAGDADQLRTSLSERAGEKLQLSDIAHPIVCLDADFQPKNEFSSPSNAVKLRPDHWPAYADAAWMEIDTVRPSPRLMALVDPLDEYRVLPDSDG